MKLLDIINMKEVKILENLELLKKEIKYKEKFVVTLKDEEYYVIFFEYVKHERIAFILSNNNFNFIGAGFITSDLFFENGKKVRGGLYFDSESCYNVYGYYKPAEEKLQKKILEDIETILKNLFEIFS